MKLRKPTISPPADLDPNTDVSWDNLITSNKHIDFPIYGAGMGYTRKGLFDHLDEVVFTGSDSVNRPMQVIAQTHTKPS